MPSPTTATLAGPSVALVGPQSGTFTVTLDQPAQTGGVVVSLLSTDASGTFQASIGGGNVASVTIPASSSSGTFYLTPATHQITNVSITTSPVLSYVGSPASCAVATVSVGGYTEIYTAAARSAIGPTWPDGSIGSVPTTGGNILFLGNNPLGTDGSGLTNYQISKVSVGSYTSLASVSNVDVTPSGVPGTYNYACGGALLRMPDNSLVAVLHLEQWPGGNQNYYYSSLALMRSTNEGAAWSWLGQIISPYLAYNGSATYAIEVGYGPIVQVGAYYYCWFPEWTNSSTYYMSVARCSAASFVSAVESGSAPTFAKYDGTSAWAQAGLGGLGYSLLSNYIQFDIWWSTLLGCLVSLGINRGDPITGWYSAGLSLSADGLNWSQPLNVLSDSGFFYTWISPITYGATTRSFSGAQFAVDYLVGTPWSNIDMRQRIATLQGALLVADEPISSLTQISPPPFATAFTNPSSGAMLEILDTTNHSMASSGTNSKIAPGDLLQGYLAAGSNVTLTETSGIVTIAASGGGGMTVGSAVSGGSNHATLVEDGSGNLAALAVGSTGQVLTVASGAPAWANPVTESFITGILSPSGYSVTASYANIGLSINLSSAGTYLLAGSLRAVIAITGTSTSQYAVITGRLYSTATSAIANSAFGILNPYVMVASGPTEDWFATVPIGPVVYTSPGSDTINVQAILSTSGGATVSGTGIYNDSNGTTSLTAIRIY